MNLSTLWHAARGGVPYASRPDLAPLTPAAYAALARSTEVRDGQAVIAGEVCGLVARRDGLHVLAIGEHTPGGPTDPDLVPVGPIDPAAKAV